MYFAEINAHPDAVLLQVGQEWLKLENSKEGLWTAGDVEVFLERESEQTRISIAAQSTPVKRIALRWRQDVDKEVRILADHWERGYGDLEWRGIAPERILPWYFMANDGENTYGYGVRTGPGAMCFWQASRYDLTLCLDVRCGGDGVQLKGRKLNAATAIAYRSSEEPFAAARAFCRAMCSNPVIPSNPVYGGNNWYYAYGESSHREMVEDSKRISDWAASNENRPFMVIDDGWQLCHKGQSNGQELFNGGPWSIGNKKFPDMAKLASEMKENHVKPGIWFRPLLTTEKVHEDLLLKRTEKTLYLDPSVGEVMEKVAEDIKLMTEWGFELIKHDFSTFDIFGRWGFQMQGELTEDGWSFSDKSRTTAEIILDFYKSIRKAAGNINIIGCNTVGHLAAGIFDMQRTGDDTSGLEWERTRKMGINTLAFRMPQHDAFFAVDADCAAITKNTPWQLAKQWLQLLAESGTPLFVSAAPDALGKEQIAAIRQAFDTASKPVAPAEPLDWFYNICPSKWFLNGKIAEFDWDDIGRSPLL